MAPETAERLGACYLLEFPNGKVYIGITAKAVEDRFAGHRRAHTQSQWRHYPLYCAMRKYGPDSVRVHTLAESEDWPTLCEYERTFIALFGSQDRALGYNCTSGGDGAPNLSSEARASRSDSIRASWDRPDTRAKRAESINATRRTRRYREGVSRRSKEQWTDPAYRTGVCSGLRRRWTDPKYREHMVSILTSKEHREKVVAASRDQKARALAALAENVPDYGIYTGMGYTEPVDFIDRVRVAVQRSMLGLEQLGERAGVSAATISNFARHMHYFRRESTLHRLAEALGVSPDPSG